MIPYYLFSEYDFFLLLIVYYQRKQYEQQQLCTRRSWGKVFTWFSNEYEIRIY